MLLSAQKVVLDLQRNNVDFAFSNSCFLLQAAVGWDYEGKTEAHASQKG